MEEKTGAYDIASRLLYIIGASIQGLKHEAPKFISADINQEADGDACAYRVKGIEEVYTNKKAGITCSR